LRKRTTETGPSRFFKLGGRKVVGGEVKKIPGGGAALWDVLQFAGLQAPMAHALVDDMTTTARSGAVIGPLPLAAGA
jgi:hypothetical protein